jgi:hypothetical protein
MSNEGRRRGKRREAHMRWHKITLGGVEEQRSMLDLMAEVWRDYPMKVPVEVRLYGDSTGQIVWHLNEGALDLYKRSV